MITKFVEVKDLTRNYGKRRGVESLSFELAEGEIVGLLGPNGCGKTTLIKLIMGLLQPDKGSVAIRGQKPQASYNLVSYLPENTYLNPALTMREALRIFVDFYRDFDQDKARRMLEEFGLELDQTLKTMSKGMQEKANLALVMSRDVPLYVLDEPMGGIDPAARETILNGILINYNPGSTLLLSTHLISDVEMLFDRVIFLDNGRIRLDRSVEELRAREGKSIDGLFREIYAPEKGEYYAL
ncbi:MAG: ABC transporter ATP-binding protein [Saccharofermentanales bacterium]|jgi:ABC-2 type transport system ATP-binding protein|nr:ABC transporter ATP-binding protein [Bacillota bacterium]NLB08805.1 ABC transporter ATP-binding protein [Clostridiales bacterium]